MRKLARKLIAERAKRKEVERMREKVEKRIAKEG